MTVARAREEAVSFGVALMVALVLLLAWPSRKSADQDLVLLTGALIAAITGLAIDIAVWQRRPELFGGKSRPTQYQVLLFAGGFVATMTYFTLRNRDVAERGLIAFLVFAVLVGVTGLVANYRWAVASRGQDVSVPGTSGDS